MARWTAWSSAAALAACVAGVALVTSRGPVDSDEPAALAIAPRRAAGPAFVPRAAWHPVTGALLSPAFADAVAREFRARALARAALEEPAALVRALRTAADDSDWIERAAALDAVARCAAAGLVGADAELVPLLVEAARDERPNVRAAGVAALGALERADAVLDDEALLAALADDPLSETRVALAELCAGADDGRGDDALALLLLDDAAPVRTAAATSLALRIARVSHAERSGDLDALLDVAAQQLRAMEHAAREDERYAFVRDLERLRPTAVAMESLLARVPFDGASPFERLDWSSAFEYAGTREQPPASVRRRVETRGLVSALAFGLGGRGDLDALLAAWFEADRWLPERQARFEFACRSEDAALGTVLLDAAVTLSTTRATDPRGALVTFAVSRLGFSDPFVQDLELESRIAEDALAVLGIERFLAAGVGGREHRSVVWRALARRGPAWTDAALALAREHAALPDVERFDRGGRVTRVIPAVDVVAALASSAHEGDALAGDGLAGLLAHERAEVRNEAFLALVRLPDARPWHAAMVEHVLATPEGDRGPLLRRLIGRQPVEPLRPTIFALGARGGYERELAVDLARAFRGDEELALRLAVWLVEACHALDARDELVRSRGERRAVQLLDALVEVSPEHGVEGARLALDVSIGRSPKLGRLAAEVLGRSEEGREALRERVGPDTDRATRLEAAAALAAAGEGATAVPALVGAFAHAPEEQQLRLLESFARTDDARVDELYLELAAGRAPDGTRAADLVQLGALAVLERRTGPAERLVELVRTGRELDVVLAALRALGGRGAAAEVVLLAAELDAPAPPGDPAALLVAPWPPRAAEAREAVRAELLVAAARAGALGTDGGLPAERWLAAPFEAAEVDLLRRFAHEPGASAEFRWRSELDTAAALAVRGEVRAALAAQGAWERADGRFLLELGLQLAFRAERAPEARRGEARAVAADLLRVAAVALLGEGPGGRAAAARALAETLSLAVRAERHGEAAAVARTLATWLARDAFPARVLEEAIEADDPASARDPLARLRALEEQCESRAALAAGDAASARRHAERARHLAAPSAAARAEQERLDALLASAGVR